MAGKGGKDGNEADEVQLIASKSDRSKLGTEGEKRTLSRRTDTGGSATCDSEVKLDQIGEEAED